MRSCALGDERRHPSQRRLFVGEQRELLVCLAVCDRRREEFRELRQPAFDVGWQGLRSTCADRHDAPKSSVDDHGHANRGSPACGPSSGRDRPLRGPGVVGARRKASSADLRGGAAVTLDGPARPDGAEEAFGSCNQGRRAVGVVVAHQHADWGIEHPCHLASDGVEHAVRSRPLGDERGYSSQRRLFVGELRELLVCLAVCDSGRHQFGELCKPIFDLIGEGRVRRRHSHRSPDRAVDDDRGSSSGVEPGFTSSGGERAGKVCVVRDAGRAAGPFYLRDHRLAVERPACSRLEHVRTVAARGDDRHQAVAVVAIDPDHRYVHHLRDLVRDGGEHLCRRCARRHERRDTSQRGLLLHESV